jgi:hypothetical protein
LSDAIIGVINMGDKMDEQQDTQLESEQKKKMPGIIKVVAWLISALILFWFIFIVGYFFSYSEKEARGINNSNARNIEIAFESHYISENSYCNENTIACGEYSFEEAFRRLYSYNKYENIKQKQVV